jgi:hypothetical protein
LRTVALTIIIFIGPVYFINAQDISVSCKNKSLNKVLIVLSETYSQSFSFDDELLSKYSVTVDTSFNSLDDALKVILKNTDLVYENTGNVWIIYPMIKPVVNNLSGIVVDRLSNEALPFSHLKIDSRNATTDISGNFTLSGIFTDSMIRIKVSHLGYYILDTLVIPGNDIELRMEPSSVGLNEIVITGKNIETSSQFGSQPGLMKLNHKIAHFLPGYGDNSIFNLIRLLPGILAAGEQTSELIIWGGYEGQSKVMFDGFTVFGLRNFNDNISSFNPLLAKEMEIHKGGYGATLGDRVGGIVNIVGKNGNPEKPSVAIVANNMTINGLAELPVSKRSSLILAIRHTYYNLYNPSDMSAILNSQSDSLRNLDLTIYPDYRFRDANIKYSHTFKNNDLFFISLHGGDDNFNYSFDENIRSDNFIKQTEELNKQSGGAIYYGHNWNNGNISDIIVSYSSLVTDYFDDYRIVSDTTDAIQYLTDQKSENDLKEYSAILKNTLNLNSKHILTVGLEFKQNAVLLDEYSFGELISYFERYNNRMTAFVEDRITPSSNFSLRAGFRVTHVPGIKHIYVEPRIGVTFKISEYWKINAAFGLYNQFLTLSTVTDEFGNFRYFWTLSAGEEIPVVGSMQYVLGIKYFKNNLLFSAEGYYKTLSGLSRYYDLINYNIQDIYYGSAESYGIDLLLKSNLKKHSAWIAYSLSKTIETFEYNNIKDTRPAPQDQRHELKIAMMLNFDPVYFSSNYVYGSGFPYDPDLSGENTGQTPYSRLDASLIYKVLDRKVKGEIGVSVLNLLNTVNVKYQSFEYIPASQINRINIQAQALPRTPTVYLKFML